MRLIQDAVGLNKSIAAEGCWVYSAWSRLRDFYNHEEHEVHEGKVAAEVVVLLKAGFDVLTILSVANTDSEVTWMGLTENQAKQQGIEYDKAFFPWAASGRSLSLG
jgi:pyruvate/2-oxoglutarate dehydrogenase complex dihydrolipoamide dehydrogenase (E3) component